jgi:hypothetical protein
VAGPAFWLLHRDFFPITLENYRAQLIGAQSLNFEFIKSIECFFIWMPVRILFADRNHGVSGRNVTNKRFTT